MTSAPSALDLRGSPKSVYFEEKEWFESLVRKLNGQGLVESSLIATLLVKGD
jgi:hypothetical protein